MWKKVSDWIEEADLTPLAMVISVAHYGPVLVSHGEQVVVAWIVGAIMDMLHFRSVRHAFHKPGWASGLVALATTVMATGYHLRFYSNDWLLALPIPIGIGIMAWHATTQRHDWVAEMQTLVETAQRAASEWQTKATQEQQRASEWQTKANAVGQEASELQMKLTQLQKELADLQDLVRRLDGLKTDAQAWRRLMQKTGGLGQGVVSFLAGVATLEQAAMTAAVHPDTIKRNAAKLNGATGHDG